MFKYKLILLSTIILFSCGKTENVKEEIKVEENIRHNKVISSTDSLIMFADKKINKIKKNHKQQVIIMDSLQNTIRVEQYTINNLNKEVKRIKGVDEILQLTKKELGEALSRCKIKEEKLLKLGDSLMVVREKLTNEKVHLINFYTTKIKSLEETIDLLNDKLSLIEEIKVEPKNKKNKKRRKSEKNN